MSGSGRWTRRRVLGTSAARMAPASLQASGKVTYWGGLIFSDDANKLLSDTITQWGKDNDVETEVVMINQKDRAEGFGGG
jgi:multiple sugar transport system substrate-binding protein